MVRKAAVLMPVTVVRPPGLGHMLYTVVEVLSVYCGRRLWPRIDIWLAGEGRLTPLAESRDLAPANPADPPDAAFERRLSDWCEERWRDETAVVVYCCEDSPLREVVSRLVEKPAGNRFITTVWCTQDASANSMPEACRHPDMALCRDANLRRLINMLDHMLLTPEDWSLAEPPAPYGTA